MSSLHKADPKARAQREELLAARAAIERETVARHTVTAAPSKTAEADHVRAQIREGCTAIR